MLFAFPLFSQSDCDPNPCTTGCCTPDCDKEKPPCAGCDPDDKESEAEMAEALDPNDIIGPNGVGAKGWIRKNRKLSYMVLYENQDTATAPAQRVEINVKLGQHVDYDKFVIGDFGVSYHYMEVKEDSNYYEKLLEWSEALGVNILVNAGIDPFNEEAYWTLQSLDTLTGLPPLDPFAGFLPPNDSLIRDGEGFVTFTTAPHPNSQTFDEIDAYAAIIFDTNDPINTSMSLLTIDDDPPTSTIDTVFYNPDSARYQIVMNGSDIGSGLKSYTLFVSRDGGKFEPLLENYTLNNAYVHLRVGTEYQFITLAKDSVDLIEPDKQVVDYTFTPENLMLNIDLKEGWNLISSYFKPATPDMLDVVSPITNEVIMVKDYEGKAAIPSLFLNSIGDWAVAEGYQLKATENTILPIAGDPVIPENTIVPIREGWQILPYLRSQPKSLERELDPINFAVTIVKDNDGNIYFPQLGIDNIVDLEPTKGYWLKSTSAGFLYYSANLQDDPTQITEDQSDFRSGEHFDLDDLNTGNNASLIFPFETLMNLHLTEGDEIGVFTTNGTLCGAGVFEEENLAFPIWGDDPQTTDEIEGLAEGETFQLKLWDSETDEEFELLFELQGGAPLYFSNGIYIVEFLEAEVTSGTRDMNRSIYFEYFPNPSTGNVNFSLGLSESTDVKLSIHSVDGRFSSIISEEVFSAGLHQFSQDFSDLAGGMYFIRVASDKGIWAYRLLMQR